MKQEIEIVNLKIKEFTKKQIANVTITLSVDKDSSYWDSCIKLCADNQLLYFKNDYFIYDETIEINPASKGILKYLKNLKEGKSHGDILIACNILSCIRALDNFWN